MILSPLLASLLVVGSFASNHQVVRPSRRSVRAQARVPIVRMLPYMSAERDVELSEIAESATYGIRIRYPAGWQALVNAERDPPLTLEMFFLSPQTSAIRTNINLVVEELPKLITLTDYSALGLATQKTILREYALLSSGPTYLAGAWPAHTVTFTAVQDGITLKFKQVWTIHDLRAYVWTFADDASRFEKTVRIFERMLESMTMRDQR